MNMLEITTTAGTRLKLDPVHMGVMPSDDMEVWARFQGPHIQDGGLDEVAQEAIVSFMREHKTEALTDGNRTLTFAGGGLAICYPERIDPNATASRTPTLVLEAQRLWRAYLAAEKEKDAKNEELRRDETRARGDVESWSLIFVGSSSDERARMKVAEEALYMVMKHAARNFAPQGGRLDVDERWLRERMNLQLDNFESLDLARAWALLEERYGGEKGHQEGHRQNARQIVDGFDLDREQPKTVAGMVVMNLRVSVEQAIGRGAHGKVLSYYCQDRVLKACTSFAAFLSAAGEDAAAADMRQFTNALWNGHRGVESRKTIRTGFGQITTYYERFEFRLLPDIARRLQVYLGTYATIEDE